MKTSAIESTNLELCHPGEGAGGAAFHAAAHFEGDKQAAAATGNWRKWLLPLSPLLFPPKNSCFCVNNLIQSGAGPKVPPTLEFFDGRHRLFD